MTALLTPYGSRKNESLVAKVATPVKIDFFQPYGHPGLGSLVAKADVVPSPKSPMPAAGRIRRLNAGVN